MRKTLLISTISLTLSLGLIPSGIAASTPKANSACASIGTTTTINKTKYVCSKNMGGKLVWMLPAPSSLSNSKPNIGGQSGFGDRHPSDEGSAADVARHAAMQKFIDCLAKNGVTNLPFGPGRRDQNGTRPTMSPQEQKAFAACSSLAPKFGPGFGRGRDDNNGGGAPRIPSSTASTQATAKA